MKALQDEQEDRADEVILLRLTTNEEKNQNLALFSHINTTEAVWIIRENPVFKDKNTAS